MDQAVIDMRELEIHQMATTGRTAQILNRQGSEIDLISRRAPIYRKSVKRREKIETIKCQGTNIQVSNNIFHILCC